MLNVFKHFHANVKKEMGMELKYIQVDNGEYKNLFEKYCRDHSIMFEKTILKYFNIMELLGE